MRQMRNVRSGKIASYDHSSIETGRWEEYSPPTEQKAIRGIKVRKLVGIGSLDVTPKESASESIERQA